MRPARELIPALVDAARSCDNEFDPAETAPGGTIAFRAAPLGHAGRHRRRGRPPGAGRDPRGVDVGRRSSTTSAARCRGAWRPPAPFALLRGSIRARNYTGAAMNRWAYERAVVQQPGAAAPNAFLLPLSKIAGVVEEGLDGASHVLPADVRRPRPDDERRVMPWPPRQASRAFSAARIRAATGARAGRRVRLRDLLRVRGPGRAGVPPCVQRRCATSRATRSGASCGKGRRGTGAESPRGRSSSPR